MTTVLRDAAGQGHGLSSQPNSIAREVALLSDLDLAGLRQRWRKLTRKDAPAHLQRHLLIGMLAYRLQAIAFGDLDREALRFLDGVARQRASGDQRPVPPIGDGRAGRLKVGSLLVREHEGTLHRVMVMPDGFAWNGATYDSLSAVARAITGTSWNGPRFFGLRERAGDKQAGNAARDARPAPVSTADITSKKNGASKRFRPPASGLRP